MTYSRTTTSTYVAWVSGIGGGLSILGSLLVIGAYIIFSDCRTFSRKLITILSVTDLLQGLFFVLSLSLGDGSSCSVMSAFGIFAAVSSFLWTSCVAYYVMKVVRHPHSNFEGLLTPFSLLSWGYPLVFVVCLLVFAPDLPSRDSDVPWCFIRTSHPFWRMFAVYLPLFVSWTFTVLWYWMARHSVMSLRAERQPIAKDTVHSKSRRRELAEVEAKLILIPLLFFLSRVWGCAYRILELVPGEEQRLSRFHWLEILTAIGDPSQGWTNGLIFVFLTRKVRERYWALLCCGFGRTRVVRGSRTTPIIHRANRRAVHASSSVAIPSDRSPLVSSLPDDASATGTSSLSLHGRHIWPSGSSPRDVPEISGAHLPADSDGHGALSGSPPMGSYGGRGRSPSHPHVDYGTGYYIDVT